MKLKFISFMVLGLLFSGCSIMKQVEVPKGEVTKYKAMTPLEFIDSLPLARDIESKGIFTYGCKDIKGNNGKLLKDSDTLCPTWGKIEGDAYVIYHHNIKQKIDNANTVKTIFEDVEKETISYCKANGGFFVPFEDLGFDSKYLTHEILSLDIRQPSFMLFKACMTEHKPYFGWGRWGNTFVFLTDDYIQNGINEEINNHLQKQENIKIEKSKKEDFKY